MKQSSLFFRSIIAFSFAVFALTSCGDETTGGGGTTADPPILEFLDNGAGSVTGDVTVAPGETLTFSVSAISGDNPMKNVRFLEDGSLVTDYATRITINGSSAATANVLLPEADKTSFTCEVTWDAHTDETTKTYAIQVVDDAGNTDEEAVIVNTIQAFPGPINLEILTNGAGGCLVANATDVTPDSWFCVNLAGTRASASGLVTLAVKENGTNMTNLARLRYNGVDFAANPLTLPAADVDGFVATVRVKAPNAQGAQSTFIFEVTGGGGGTATDAISISTMSATPDITTHIGVLFNKSGPTGTGGLDLETGASTGSANAAADIKDAGNISSTDQEWIRKIQPVGTNILSIAPTSAEFPTTFDNITLKSEISDAYNLSAVVTRSPVVNVGDVFLVNNGTNIFIIKCTNVNVTPGDNNDSYTFDVKF